MRPDAIVGYVYSADIYCPSHIAGALAAHGLPVSPGELDNAEAAEVMLDELARIRGVARGDERTFDSDDFPKVIFADTARDEDDRCGSCHGFLVMPSEPVFRIIVNMPGYLPESDPYMVVGLKAAREAASGEVFRMHGDLMQSWSRAWESAELRARELPEEGDTIDIPDGPYVLSVEPVGASEAVAGVGR